MNETNRGYKKTWFTADQHFGHANIIKYCNRPFKDSYEMDKAIIKNYNLLVEKDDIVYFIGDLTLRTIIHKQSIRQIVNKLNGKKHLILGNHDKLNPFDYIDIGFISVHTSLEINDFILNHDPADSCINRNKTWLTGHIHELYKEIKNVINVGVDVWDFKPVDFNDIKALKFDDKTE